jgi:hypothetical protein
MAYITVTTSDTAFKVDFGVYAGISASSGPIPIKRSFMKVNVVFSQYVSMVEAQTINNHLTFPITYNGSEGTFKVDSVNGVAPTSNEHLYEMLEGLL